MECHTKTPTKKGYLPPGGKPTKPFQHPKDMALKNAEIIKFHPSSKLGEGTLISLEENPGMSNSDYDDDPLVSRPIMPIELLVPGMEEKVATRFGMHQMLNKPNPSGKTGDPPKKTEETDCLLPVK